MNNFLTQKWPEEELEHLGFCPVCGKVERSILYNYLQDQLFLCAPGNWTMWHCNSCGLGYLDPRPNEKSIHLAYRNYYTHDVKGHTHEKSVPNFFKKCRNKIRNGYTNWRYGTNNKPSTQLGLFFICLLGKKGRVDRAYRHLPRLNLNKNKLLDVGCGNGSFLNFAKSFGWDVVGVDFDPSAISNCKCKELKIHLGGLESLECNNENFNVITISHVIEHIHSPQGMLKKCSELLVKGGMIWIETPNIESLGHKKYGRAWRGLEPPRHLAIFNFKSIRLLLEKCGFSDVKLHFCPGITRGIYKESKLQAETMSAKVSDKEMIPSRIEIMLVELITRIYWHKREFITISAKKNY